MARRPIQHVKHFMLWPIKISFVNALLNSFLSKSARECFPSYHRPFIPSTQSGDGASIFRNRTNIFLRNIVLRFLAIHKKLVLFILRSGTSLTAWQCHRLITGRRQKQLFVDVVQNRYSWNISQYSQENTCAGVSF